MLTIQNINEIDLINALEKACPNADTVLASYKALLSLNTNKPVLPTIEKQAMQTPAAKVVTSPSSEPKKTWCWGDIGIFAGYTLVNKITGFKFTVKEVWAKKKGLEFAGRNMAWARKYVAESIIAQMKGVESLTAHDVLIEGKKTTPSMTQWEVFDQNGIDTGRTVAAYARSKGFGLYSKKVAK